MQLIDHISCREIDRVFKKVKEGLDEFDFIYEKLQDCDNQSQKEKLESDLKKEIKKLQRSRELIKNWMSGTEVKDKKSLIEHRKMIEREMERFKEVEKMMKTKAFSNEALASTNEVIDPRSKEKMETAEFIQGNIEELQIQMESMEGEIHQIQSTLKKKKSDAAKQAQIVDLQESYDRHKWHITMLESILRHLENDNLDVDQINDVKEDIEYYVESNQDPNFIEDDTFYDVLGLDDLEDSFAVIPGDESELIGSSSRSHSVADDTWKDKDDKNDKDKEREKEKEREKAIKKEKNVKAEKSGTTSKLTRSVSPPTTSSAGANILTNSGVKQATPVGTPKIKYASAVLSGIKKTPVSNSSMSSPTISTLQPAVQTPTSISYASLAQSVNASNAKAQQARYASQQVTAQQDGSDGTNTLGGSTGILTASSSTFGAAADSTAPIPTTDTSNAAASSHEIPSLSSATDSTSMPTTGSIQSQSRQSTVETPVHNLPRIPLEQISELASQNANRILSNSNAKNPQINNIQENLAFLNSENYSNLPQGFEKYLQSLETVKDRIFEFKKPEELHVPSKKSQPPPMLCDLKLPKLEDITVYLESSLLNCPDSYDSDKPHNYIPANPFVTQPSFPTEPLPEMIGSTKLLEKVSLDTLFYGFYYNNLRFPSKFTAFHNLEYNSDDEYLQYIIAKELHRRGWNYQSQTHTWFSKDDENDSATVISGDATGNHWRSFDFTDTWMVRRNNNFDYNVADVETAYF